MSGCNNLKHTFYNEILPKNWKIKTVDSIKSKEKYSCTAGPFGPNISSKYFVDCGVLVIRGGPLLDCIQVLNVILSRSEWTIHEALFVFPLFLRNRYGITLAGFIVV
jgi:hypothetical protein